jgi:hypothetical protein
MESTSIDGNFHEHAGGRLRGCDRKALQTPLMLLAIKTVPYRLYKTTLMR